VSWWYSNNVDLQYDTTKPIIDATFLFTYLFSSCIINKYRDICSDMPDSPVWPPPSCLTLSEGVILWKLFVIFGGWVAGWPGYNTVQKYPRKVKTPWVGCTHVTDHRQTDGFAMSLAKRNVVMIWFGGWKVKATESISAFLRASAMLKHVIDIGWTSVCLSVRPSVTRWYCIKTTEHIDMLSSPF